MQGIEITEIENYGDARGALYNISDSDLQFLDKIQNIHFGKIHPNAIRGNHYHRQGKEMLIISYSDVWTLVWAKNDSAQIFIKEFTGAGAVMINIPEGVVHALKNTGDRNMELIALSNNKYTKENADTFSKILIE